jgi:hypothetical protein
MKANELMIGDWLYRPDCYDQVKEIRHTGVIGIDNLRGLIAFSELEPIPLTPEILKKNGFVANKHVYPYPYYEYINEEDKLKIGFAFPQGNRTSYKESWVYIDSERVFVEHLPCVFVHKLQHALKLCGIEKEIEL